ncbi:phage holin family protein [Bacillus sp. ISL-75]|uniref:phage holin family protein n=1 Tax=Bacillus sp. ISL-75 TaxID=2819137 RepID=UPI0020364EEB|nr:phage holin family protein [Bacillus sp. ISL-75]
MKHGKEALLMHFDITTIVGNVWYVALGFILFDVVTGLLAAAIERKLNSSINYVGMIRKVGEFVALAFLVFIDAYVGANGLIIKLGVGMIVAYEAMSIIENFSRIGIDMKFLTKYFDKDKIGTKRKKGADK